MKRYATRATAILLALGALAVGGRAAGPGGEPVRQSADRAAKDEGPAARRAAELLALVESGDYSAIAAYARANYAPAFLDGAPLDVHVGFVFRLRETGGGFESHGFQEVTPTRAVALLRSKLTGDWSAIAVEVEPAAPNRIVGLGSAPPNVPASAAGPAKRLTLDEASRELDAFVTKLAEAGAFSGSVLLAKDGRVLYAKAFGEANKDFGAPNRVDTKFNLGSMNKMFTAVSIAQLVERGKLSYEDPLSKFLPDFPDPASAGKIRIKHLLSHTSGLGSYFNDKFFDSSRAKYRTVDDMMELAKGETLQFEPGTKWSYSNTGMLVLGKVIEKVTGESYFDYVRENVYKPAGMANTDCYELDGVNPNLAVGYDKEYSAAGVRFRNNLYTHVMRGGPAGGGFSTVEDLLKFSEALRAGKLVSAASYALLTSPKPELNSPSYGYGFQVDTAGRRVGHSGGFVGISSNLDMYMDGGYTTVVMSNYSGAAGPVVRKMAALVKATL